MIQSAAELTQLHAVLAPPPARPAIPARSLLPALLVITLALLGGAKTGSASDPCAPSDGPQFRCWLDRQ
jgi:hypothetical protein